MRHEASKRGKTVATCFITNVPSRWMQGSWATNFRRNIVAGDRRASRDARRSRVEMDLETCSIGFVGDWSSDFGWTCDSRRDPIGVVKLLRARGGCLGVIRWWAWRLR